MHENEREGEREIETLEGGGGGGGGGMSHVKRGLFLGRLSMFLRGNSVILCVSISLNSPQLAEASRNPPIHLNRS